MQSAHFSVRCFSLDVAGLSPCTVNVISHQKKRSSGAVFRGGCEQRTSKTKSVPQVFFFCASLAAFFFLSKCLPSCFTEFTFCCSCKEAAHSVSVSPGSVEPGPCFCGWKGEVIIGCKMTERKEVEMQCCEIDGFSVIPLEKKPRNFDPTLMSNSAVESVSKAYPCEVGRSFDGDSDTPNEFVEMQCLCTGQYAFVEPGKEQYTRVSRVQKMRHV